MCKQNHFSATMPHQMPLCCMEQHIHAYIHISAAMTQKCKQANETKRKKEIEKRNIYICMCMHAYANERRKYECDGRAIKCY